MIKKVSLYLLSGFYFFAGINHFRDPNFYLGLIPDYFPAPEMINYSSGFAECILAILVLINPLRKLAIYGIIIMLIAFIPSHIYFIQIGSCVEGGLCVSEWISWGRLLLIHPLLMFWAWTLKNK